MKSTDVQRLFGYAAPAKRIEAIATSLREGGHLPKGGRGPYAPDVTPQQVAIFILAAANPRRIVDAASDAIRLSELVNSEGALLASCVVAALRSEEKAHALASIRFSITDTYCFAEIRNRDSNNLIYFAEPKFWKDPSFTPSAQGSAYVGPIGHIGGGLIHQLAIDFATSPEDEEGEFLG